VDARALKAVLRTLRENGVESFEHDGLKVQFAPQVAALEPVAPDVEGDLNWLESAPPDPRIAIKAVYARDAARRKAARS